MARIFLLTILISTHAVAAPPVEDETTGNLRFNLVAALAKTMQFDLDFRLTSKWTIGPSIAFFNTKASPAAGGAFRDDHSISGYSAAVRGNYYPKGIWKTGWYAETSLNYLSATVNNRDINNTPAASTPYAFIITGGGGYHWFWDPLNVNLGLMAGYPLKPATATMNSVSAPSEEVQITGSSISIGARCYVGVTF